MKHWTLLICCMVLSVQVYEVQSWGLLDSIKGGLNNAKNKMDSAWNTVSDGAQSVGKTVASGADTAWNAVKDVAESAGNTVGSGAESAFNTVKNGAKTALSKVKRQVQSTSEATEATAVNTSNNVNQTATIEANVTETTTSTANGTSGVETALSQENYIPAIVETNQKTENQPAQTTEKPIVRFTDIRG